MMPALRLHLHRLLVAPRVQITRATPDAADVTVHGLVCGVCALRTRAALLSVPGVREACVDLRAGTATLRLAPGAAPDERALQRALEGVVIAMPVRRAMERWSGRLIEVLRGVPPGAAEGRDR